MMRSKFHVKLEQVAHLISDRFHGPMTWRLICTISPRETYSTTPVSTNRMTYLNPISRTRTLQSYPAQIIGFDAPYPAHAKRLILRMRQIRRLRAVLYRCLLYPYPAVRPQIAKSGVRYADQHLSGSLVSFRIYCGHLLLVGLLGIWANLPLVNLLKIWVNLRPADP
jgi:hypothetical protein